MVIAFLVLLPILVIGSVIACVRWLPPILQYLCALVGLIAAQALFGGFLLHAFGNYVLHSLEGPKAVSFKNAIRLMVGTLPIWLCATIVFIHVFCVIWYLLAQCLKDGLGIQRAKLAMRFAIYQGTAIFVALLVLFAIIETIIG